MIRLDFKREPHWLDLGHGVRLHVRTCTSALIMAARAGASRRFGTHGSDEPAAAGLRMAALLKSLAHLAVDAWEGVGDGDGKPVGLTPEGLDALLDLWPFADAFERLYLGPALLIASEKNV